MQNSRFVVLTGHLNNYPLSDLIGILRHQKKTGRLLIEYPKGPATLFFENGDLIDVRLNDLVGLQAICVLVAQPDASFNFNPLIRSSQRSIDATFQRVVSELFGCWDESAIQIESSALPPTPQLNPAPDVTPAPNILEGRRVEPLALPPAPTPTLGQRSFLMAAAAVLIIIGISTVIAVTGSLKKSETVSQRKTEVLSNSSEVVQAVRGTQEPSARGVETTKGRSAEFKREIRSKTAETSTQVQPRSTSFEDQKGNEPATSPSTTEAIKVVMQIENGRVLKASIANHAPGMDGFEALALRIARQRRYPAVKNGAETVTINVNKPD